jgi:hypothetical protein
VAFATLNYDTLLEQSMARFCGIGESRRWSYAREQWLIAKLHGSVDWGYPWRGAERFSNAVEALELIGAPDLNRKDIQSGIDHSMRWADPVYYPAMALPVAGKYGFLCSPHTETILAEFVRNSAAIVFIGFSGQDRDLLEFLEANIGDGLRYVEIVSFDDAEAVRDRLVQGVPKLQPWLAQNQFGLRNRGFGVYLENDFDSLLDKLG